MQGVVKEALAVLMAAEADAGGEAAGGGPGAESAAVDATVLFGGDGHVDREARAVVAKELFALHRLVSNVANNVNQIAKVANSTRVFDDEGDQELRANFELMRRLAFRLDAVLDGFRVS
ncbi:plasmid mobilization relaxosome protein MobC [Nocardia sp. NPDC058176]|uniref:plasmid mobilization relaxosome protein MobC n=1 Tax=Nocardia sp. NPDC058176 TaxID=3346368 RepID=UPI0036D97E1E